MLFNPQDIKLIFLDILKKHALSAYLPVDLDFSNPEDFTFSLNLKDHVTLRLTYFKGDVFNVKISNEERNFLDRVSLENAIEFGINEIEMYDIIKSEYSEVIYGALSVFEKYGITVEHLKNSGNLTDKDVIKYHSHFSLPLPIRD